MTDQTSLVGCSSLSRSNYLRRNISHQAIGQSLEPDSSIKSDELALPKVWSIYIFTIINVCTLLNRIKQYNKVYFNL